MIVVSLTAMLVCPVPLQAQPDDVATPVSILLVDSRAAESQITVDPAPSTVLVLAYSDISGGTVDCLELPKSVATTQIWAVLECAAGDRLASVAGAHRATNPDPKNLVVRSDAAALLGRVISQSSVKGTSRAISTQGDRILLAVLQTATLRRAEIESAALAEFVPEAARLVRDQRTSPVVMPAGSGIDLKARVVNPLPTLGGSVPLTVTGRIPKIGIKEVERRSQIGRDVEALVKIASSLIGAPRMEEVSQAMRALEERVKEQLLKAKLTTVPVTWMTVASHAFLLERATVTTDVTFPADGALRQFASGVSVETLKALEALIQQSSDQEQLAALEKAVHDLETCPPEGLKSFSQLHLLACQLFGADTQAEVPAGVAAAEGLAELAVPEALGTLRKVVLDSSIRSEIRTAAIRALGKLPKPPAPKAPAATDRPTAARNATLISGPAEHWFLSADVLWTRKTLGRDTAGNIALNTPPVFYLGFDFLLGDLPSAKRSLLENVVVKGLIKGSNRPQDSFGVGVGLRGSYLKRFGLDFELLSPFAAWTLTRVKADEPRDGSLRLGVSVNVDTALKWIK